MKRVKNYLKVILGSFIIGATFNLFFTKYKLIPAGMFGFSLLYSSYTGYDLAKTLFLANIFFLALGFITIPKKKLNSAILPFILVPIFTYLTKDIGVLINIEGAEKLLITIFGGVLDGIGYKFIYNGHGLVSGSDIVKIISKYIVGEKSYSVSYIFDILWIIISLNIFGIENTLYSIIAIIIIEIISKRTRVGISNSKVFYVITKKDSEVRKFILEKMHYELTVFDVKGGFSKNKNKILMSAIPTRDYYRLREGIKSIDPDAFIAITDTYEVICKNI